MTVEAFRIQNFMGFEDSGWIELWPITLLFGRNSVGKSAILRALLLLKQSLDYPPEVGPLWFVKDDGYDFGDYIELVRDHEPKPISFWFRCRFRRTASIPIWYQFSIPSTNSQFHDSPGRLELQSKLQSA